MNEDTRLRDGQGPRESDGQMPRPDRSGQGVAGDRVPGTATSPAAGVYAALGDNDKAFEELNRAYGQHDMQLVSLKVDPTLDELRDDIRFAEIVRRVGLPN